MKPFTGRLFQTNIDNAGRVAARTRVLGFFEGLARSVRALGRVHLRLKTLRSIWHGRLRVIPLKLLAH